MVPRDDKATDGFAERLREIRLSRRHMPQHRIADMIGVNRSTYQSWERPGEAVNSHRPTARHLRDLARVLGCREHHLHEPPGSPIPPPRRRKL